MMMPGKVEGAGKGGRRKMREMNLTKKATALDSAKAG